MARSDKVSLHGLKILVVEDDSDLRESVREVLRLYGARVIEAENGRTGLNSLREESIDLILSDIRMPGGDGISFLEKVREINPDIPFIFLTGFSDLTLEEALRKGAQGIFTKPYNSQDLAKTISRHTRVQKA